MEQIEYYPRRVVYIASPYTTGDPHENVKRQIRAAHKLMDRGYCPIAPLLSHYMHLERFRPWTQWMQIDLELLRRSDALWRLPGPSRGADLEVQFAIQHGIPVVHDIEELKGIWRPES